MPIIHKELERLVEQIRDEARQVRSCFTQYSFSSIGFCSLIIGAEVAALEKMPLASLASIPAVYLLMRVSRLGLHKFSTANRHYGYQLHLERTNVGPTTHAAVGAGATSKLIPWDETMRYIGWEEALRAWRIVQPKLFSSIYCTPTLPGVIADFVPWYYRPITSPAEESVHGYSWFMPKKLAKKKGGQYHGGSYLKTVLMALFVLQLMAVAPIGFAAFVGSTPLWVARALIITCLIVASLACLHFVQVSRRREILENELLSIHSSAIVWQAIVVAHFRALAAVGPSLRHYTENLADISNNLAENKSRIHDWSEGKL